ncbi:MAG: hypothetical protein M1828_002000 [Chrysothrix sp. TS-e1954]|nr:MAG: hypothetical protein M1828_002000 [Chrysothrix sp. TS-e1954]
MAPIKRLLVANRGEIATRIISTARELSLDTYALCSGSDTSHTLQLADDHVIRLASATDYLDISRLVSIANQNSIDAVHPGYGFLSESPEFASRMQAEAHAMVIGPGADILRRTGDKLAAKQLAAECHVPVLAAMQSSTDNIEDVEHFITDHGLPIMLKAVDGGGGRGIRLVREHIDLAASARRAMQESPSNRVFAERAVVDNCRHIEVQILGDRSGHVMHLWERECSIQRRYQKVVEVAPSTISDRELIDRVIQSAVTMAEKIRYSSLGTFEFLVDPATKEYWFLEINPRLQVEHTVTETMLGLDLVKLQLEIAQGASLKQADLALLGRPRPYNHAIQLRITAENVDSDWSLSIGKIRSFNLPSGNGVRVDTHLNGSHQATITADFDSLIAKIIVSGPTWADALRKGRRALQDTYIHGVRTNIGLLQAILVSEDFERGQCNTSWLESNMPALLPHAQQLEYQRKRQQSDSSREEQEAPQAMSGLSSSSVLLRKGDSWSLQLSPMSESGASGGNEEHHLKLLRVRRNELPGILQADIAHTQPAKDSTSSSTTKQWRLALNATNASAASIASGARHRRGDPSNANHVVIPFAGKMVEILVDEGDVVKKGEPICVIQQMKMELEVRAGKAGRVKWMMEVEEGEDVGEGLLAAELEEYDEKESRPRL